MLITLHLYEHYTAPKKLLLRSDDIQTIRENAFVNNGQTVKYTEVKLYGGEILCVAETIDEIKNLMEGDE